MGKQETVTKTVNRRPIERCLWFLGRFTPFPNFVSTGEFNVNVSKNVARVATLGSLLVVFAAHNAEAQRTRRTTKSASTKTVAISKDPKKACLAVVDAWEKAYTRKDAKYLINTLMVPSSDNAVLEKRYQWLRGYGPNDLPGSVHPPILFKTSKGSFVPKSYKVLSTTKLDATHYDIAVQELGTYSDEDGLFKVDRNRHIKLTLSKGKWWVMDYYLADSPEDYGFYVDDIRDKVTLVKGK